LSKPFGLERTNVWNLNLELVPEIIEYQEGHKLLIENIALQNVGKIAIKPSELTLSAWVLSRDEKEGSILGTQIEKTLVKDSNLLRFYPGEYLIEPGVRYNEFEAIVVKEGDLVLLKATMIWADDDDLVTDYKIVSITNSEN